MDVEQLMQKLRTLLGDLDTGTPEGTSSPYVALALDSVVSVLNVIRAAELTIAAGAPKATVEAMLREHMLGRMQREAVFMGRLAEQPAATMESRLQDRQDSTGKRKARPRPGVGWVPGH